MPAEQPDGPTRPQPNHRLLVAILVLGLVVLVGVFAFDNSSPRSGPVGPTGAHGVTGPLGPTGPGSKPGAKGSP